MENPILVSLYFRMFQAFGNEFLDESLRKVSSTLTDFFGGKSENKDKNYVLFMLDTNRSDDGFYVNWILRDIPREALRKGYLKNFHQLPGAYYLPPQPEPKSGPHTYKLYLFHQHEKFILKNTELISRDNFNLKEFAVNYRLCGPVAATEFRAQF